MRKKSLLFLVVPWWAFGGQRSLGDFPGGRFNMHGASVNQQSNLYIAEVASSRAQEFRPRSGANPDFAVGKMVYAAWK